MPLSWRVGPERVLHGARRVVGPEVERVEVEPLGLDDRALGDLPAHRDEDVGDQLGAGGDRVPGADGDPVGRQRDVDGLLDQHPLLVLGLEHGLAGGERLVDGTAGLADPLAGLLARLRRQRADLAVGERERRPVAGVVDPHLLERGEVGRGRDRGERGVARGLDLLGLQRGDLHGVVVGVRSGHVCLSSAVQRGVQLGKSRKVGAARANRFHWRVERRCPASRRPGQHDDDPGAAAGGVLDRDGAAVGPDQAVDEVEARARSRRARRPSRTW